MKSNRTTRDACVQQMTLTLDALHGESNDINTARSLQANYDELLQHYLDALPCVPIARCPFTKELLEVPFDTFGLDGIWWDVNGPGSLSNLSTNHIITTGAFQLNGDAFADSPLIHTIMLGPALPFVIPKLMHIASVRCVIYPLSIGKHRAFLMSYFSDQPTNSSDSQPWLRTRTADEDCDFRLESWIDQTNPTRLFWIDPEDDTMKLRSGTNEFPYLNLDGTKDFQVIRDGKLTTMQIVKDSPC